MVRFDEIQPKYDFKSINSTNESIPGEPRADGRRLHHGEVVAPLEGHVGRVDHRQTSELGRIPDAPRRRCGCSPMDHTYITSANFGIFEPPPLRI